MCVHVVGGGEEECIFLFILRLVELVGNEMQEYITLLHVLFTVAFKRSSTVAP